MKTKKVKALTNMTLFVETDQDDINLKPMSGRILVNTVERCSLFVPHKKRGPRSVEMMRTEHSRTVMRPDGKFTTTFRYSIDDILNGNLSLEMGNIEINLLLNNLKNIAA